MARTNASVNGTVNAQEILRALRSVKKGDFTVRMSDGQQGINGQIADAFNELVEMLEKLHRRSIAHHQGRRQGRPYPLSAPVLGGPPAPGQRLVDSINTLIADLVKPTEEVSRVIGAVAKGDLSQRMSLEIEGRPLKGEFLRIGPSSTPWWISSALSPRK